MQYAYADIMCRKCRLFILGVCIINDETRCFLFFCNKKKCAEK